MTSDCTKVFNVGLNDFFTVVILSKLHVLNVIIKSLGHPTCALCLENGSVSLRFKYRVSFALTQGCRRTVSGHKYRSSVLYVIIWQMLGRVSGCFGY